MSQKLLEVKNLKVTFSKSVGFLQKPLVNRAVNDVSFDLEVGEILGIVGESGCGKSTLGKAILKLIPCDEGKILWLGKDVTRLSQKENFKFNRLLQVVFQDPLSSLNPRMTIGDIIGEPLRIHQPSLAKDDREEEVAIIMNKVGLDPENKNRFPHEFSGGQCQRICIARALILKPKLIICDEPVSALDVSIQSQIVNLLQQLCREENLSLIFISHDLSVVRYLCDRIIVLYMGKIMEVATRKSLFQNPSHPYTQALLASVPRPVFVNKKADNHFETLEGDIPSPYQRFSGCAFASRCKQVQEICRIEKPKGQKDEKDATHLSYCHFSD